ncbi:YveK family protein [Haloimpatiens sp. FM7330]|uniref:YveK family protein n=1 Tax=Haloimpatiens sp. FM7330 TaxID=3298610 RepID=UPI0036275AE2
MQEEFTLDLKDFFEILRKRIKLILCITLISTLLAGIISFFVIKPTYESKVSVVIGKQDKVSKQEQGYSYNDVMMYQKLVKTYAEIAKSKVVANRTIKKLNLQIDEKDFENIVKVTPQADTQILDIKAESKDPKEARDIAKVLTESFIERSKELLSNGEVQILDKAEIPEKAIKPKKKLNIAIAFLLGLMVSVGAAFVLEYMDNTIKTENDVEKYLDIPVIGLIPEHHVD